MVYTLLVANPPPSNMASVCVYVCVSVCVCYVICQTSEGKDGNDGKDGNADIATCAQWCTEEGFEHVISCKSPHEILLPSSSSLQPSQQCPAPSIYLQHSRHIVCSHRSLSLSLSLSHTHTHTHTHVIPHTYSEWRLCQQRYAEGRG